MNSDNWKECERNVQLYKELNAKHIDVERGRNSTGPAGEGRGGERGTSGNYGGGVQHASWKPNPTSGKNM